MNWKESVFKSLLLLFQSILLHSKVVTSEAPQKFHLTCLTPPFNPLPNFTKLCLPIEKTLAHSIGQKICHSISPTKFKPNKRAEICQICMPFAKRHWTQKTVIF